MKVYLRLPPPSDLDEKDDDQDVDSKSTLENELRELESELIFPQIGDKPVLVLTHKIDE